MHDKWGESDLVKKTYISEARVVVLADIVQLIDEDVVLLTEEVHFFADTCTAERDWVRLGTRRRGFLIHQ